MLQKRIKEESGMALALAMMVVVLVGVMGAGLLLFVTRDLDSVIESNRGQTAFNLADAGVQAAKSHLLDVDALYLSYDGDTINTGGDPPNPPDSNWSCGTWDPTTQTCSAVGRSLTLDPPNNNNVRVWIQYLRPALNATQANDATGVYAPEIADPVTQNYPIGQDYFKVISQGTVGQTKRKVEAIFKTNANNNQGLPRAVYTQGNIDAGGTQARVTNMSLFAELNISVTGGAGSDFVQGVDLAFGDWNKAPNPNTLRRSSYPPGPTLLGSPCTTTLPPPTGLVTGECAGLGAAGTISPNSVMRRGRDYDGRATRPAPLPSCSTPYPQFRSQDPTSPNYPLTTGCTRMTFPFTPTPPDIDSLRYAAQSQSNGIGGDNYYPVTSTTSIENPSNGETKPVWPADNKASTVVFVEFPPYPGNSTPYNSNNIVNWNLNLNPPNINCPDNPPPVRGTLVVVNGRFQTGNNMTPLRGLVVVSGVPADVPSKPAYTSTGNSCMQNFISASGDIKINGNVGAGTLERGSVPTSYSLGLVSWRELYK